MIKTPRSRSDHGRNIHGSSGVVALGKRPDAAQSPPRAVRLNNRALLRAKGARERRRMRFSALVLRTRRGLGLQSAPQTPVRSAITASCLGVKMTPGSRLE